MPSQAPRILVADDDPTMLELLGTVLRQEGYEVDTAADAMQAVMRTVRNQPDAVILDVRMPGGTGVTALGRLRQLAGTRELPVVVVTSTPTPDLLDHMAALGALAVLEKPIDIPRLLGLLAGPIGRMRDPGA